MKKEKKSILENRKANQRNKILSVIRFGEEVSRKDLRNSTSYSMTTVLSVVEELLKEGLIYEEECEESRVGRKPIWLKINPQGGYFLGIEFNARCQHSVVLNFSGEKIYSKSGEMDGGDTPEKILDKIQNGIEEAKAFLGEKNKRLLGIGIGIPGYVDSEKGMARSYRHFENWRDIPVREILEERTGLPVYIENNVNVMALAYKWLYFQDKREDFIFLSIRTGARMIPVINNKLVYSKSGFSGEIGHIKIASSHYMCSCGSFECLNSEISDYGISARIREGIAAGRFRKIKEMVQGDLEQITVGTFVASVQKGHGDSLCLLENVAKTLGMALGMVINILAPREIILFGELAALGLVFTDLVKQYADQGVIPENRGNYRIEIARGGRDLGGIGAAALVMQQQLNFVESPI